MKKFEDIVKLTQIELKNYLRKFLISKDYTVVSQDGFLYAKGTIPVLLVAHMDTVHKETVKTIERRKDNKGRTVLSSPQGIGGDDRCGCYIIMECIKQGNMPSVLFLEDEEKGCVGAKKFAKTNYINNLDINFMVELDRRNAKDAVFYSCDNKDFVKFVEDNTDHKLAYGSCSDISTLMPASKIAGVNLSVGYYNEHTLVHTVIVEEMMDTLDCVIDLLNVKVEKPFEYIEKKYTYHQTNWDEYYNLSNRYGDYYGNNNGRYASSYDAEKEFSKPVKHTKKKKLNLDTTLYLSVVFMSDDDYDIIATEYDEGTYCAEVEGNTKAECWMSFFETFETVCLADVVEYEFY